jgi:hypothetical protein
LLGLLTSAIFEHRDRRYGRGTLELSSDVSAAVGSETDGNEARYPPVRHGATRDHDSCPKLGVEEGVKSTSKIVWN